MALNIDQKIIDFLELVLQCNIQNFKVKVHGGNDKGEGFLGEMIYVSLEDKNTGSEKNLVVKKVRPSETERTRNLMTSIYFNEILYYTKVFPALINFQKSHPEIKNLDYFPICYGSSLDRGFEKLCLENLKSKNYEIHPKSVPMDPKCYEKIFKMYADFHALSFAFKNCQPDEFFETTKGINNSWKNLLEIYEDFSEYATHLLHKIKVNLEELKENDIIKKLDIYIEDANKVLIDCTIYNGCHGTILHGDCWSNNIMFKYGPTKEIEHIKMIDFQQGYIGSLVTDLSHSLYAGASKKSLDSFEKLLKQYHANLGEALKKYGCDIKKIYPYEIFKKEWKQYSRFGFVMAIVHWTTKLATDVSNVPTINDLIDKKSDVSKNDNYGLKYNQEVYWEIILDLIRHMDENDFL